MVIFMKLICFFDWMDVVEVFQVIWGFGDFWGLIVGGLSYLSSLPNISVQKLLNWLAPEQGMREWIPIITMYD